MVYFVRIIIIYAFTPWCFADLQKVSNEGSALPAITLLGTGADDWACIHDSESNLIWEIKTANGGLRDIEWTYTWFDSDPLTNGGFAGFSNDGDCFDASNCDTEKYKQQVNKQSLCGANDWRLPTSDELFLVWLNSPLFINGQHSDSTKGFWSSTIPQSTYDAEGVVVVLPATGGGFALKNHLHGVRLVRDGKNYVEVDFKEAPFKIENWPFPKPGQIVIGADETLFVTDLLNHRIVNLSGDGVEINSFGQFSADEDSSLELAIAPDGTLYVADIGNSRIQNFKTDGSLISEFSYNNQYGSNHINNMIVTSNGNLFLVFQANVQHLNTDGEIIWEFQHNTPAAEPDPNFISTFYPDSMEMITIADNGSLSILNVEPSIATSFTFQYMAINLTADGKLIEKISLCCANDYPEDLFPKKEAVSTKEGIVFEVEKDPQHLAVEGSIRKKIPNIAEYSYTHGTGIAIFDNISVGNEHYWVSLQNQGDLKLKVLKAYRVNPAIENDSSTYDPQTGLVTLPRVAADGVYYSVTLQRLNNGLFSVQSATTI